MHASDDPDRQPPCAEASSVDRVPLEELVDVRIARALIDGVFAITGIPAGIVDLKGRVVLPSRFEEVCERFYRVHPATRAACLESDSLPGRHVLAGTSCAQRCGNGLWDLSAPIVACDRHVGNLFVGQFLYEDEAVDLDRGREEARRLGFDVEAYLAALARVPRWSREKVAAVMDAYTGLAGVISAVATRTHELRLALAERETLVASLEESRERLRMAAEASGLGTWVHDRRTGLVRGDERARRQFAFDKAEGSIEEVMGRVHPDDRAMLASAIGSVSPLTSGSWRGSLEYRVVHPGGDVRWLSVFVRTLVEGEGDALRVVGTLGTSQDITERKRAEETQARAQKLEALGTLAGGIAHDFNNILLAIQGNASLAADELGAAHPVRPLVDEIARAGTRASSLVQQILAFARPHDAQRRAAPLAPVVDEALRLLRATLPARIALVTRWGEDVPDAVVDAGQVHQVVVNVVTNAAHAIGARPGRIELALERVEVGEGPARPAPGLMPGGYVRLTVRDDGCGMDRATAERAFDPFFTTKGPGEGTGLGLSVVHGILRSHRGAAAIESAPGQGTTVSLYLPSASSPGASAPPAPRPREPERRRAERVLVVDDDEAIALLSRRLLGRLGYKVTAFTDPAAAVAAFTASPGSFDAAVSDLSMPRMTGFDVAAALLAAAPSLPVVLTSGYVRPEDEEAAARLGVRAVICKPNTVDELAAALDAIFQAQPERPGA